ncbi:MAG: TlpA disulfide reductase family protein [Akkermansiaceae bacterium]|nr:TlpA disulfide reductase family protein [Akkermansiaceae bacterium]
MRSLRAAVISLIFLGVQSSKANPEMAAKIEKLWDSKVAEWREQAEKAKSHEELAALEQTRPDPAAYARRMWGSIENSLQEPWTIRPAAWFLQIAPGIKDPETGTPLFEEQINRIKKSLLANHIHRPDPQLNAICMALARLGDPLSLSIIESIESKNEDPKIQGVAALAAAMVVKNLGDDGELMRKRLTYLKKAIINSAEVKIGETSVAELAENELYLIRYLSKGRVAPEITGTDSNKQPFRLSQQRGKVVILIFWSSSIPQAAHTIEFTNEMATNFAGKPVQIVGINHDPADKLKAMRADGTVTWRNLSDPQNLLAKNYRVGSWPMVYVLDQKGKIRYSGGLGSFAELTANALLEE